MDKLSAQDAGFLKIESAHCPFHVAGLMVLKMPEDAPRNFIRKLVDKCGRLNELWPVFARKLSDPESTSDLAWVEAVSYTHLTLPTN